MRFTFDPWADAAYVYLTGEPLMPGRESVICDEPESRGNGLTVVMDWKDGKLVGVEVLGAFSVLHADLLVQAERPFARQAEFNSPAVRITHDPVEDAAYIYLTGEPLLPGSERVTCYEEDGPGAVIMDWKDEKIVGIKVPTASRILRADFLAQAQPLGRSQASADQTET